MTTGLSAYRRTRQSLRSSLIRIACIASAVVLAIGSAAAQELKKSATVEIEQVQIAFIGSGNLGGGKLHFNGRTYDFTIGGLGIGGFGISKIEAYGTAYNLKDLASFPGGYVQGRYGLAVGTVSTGELWLKNPSGVVLKLKAKREGLALSLGGDAIYIKLD